ncbi:GAF domain-containing protein [Heyndrickxia oleronia]|uniref:GAF domain-containing protein n=1 Tax=Heyndrickxia oleronia TaxID=38875 RepID=UPI0020412A7B|nr:GAF domain-containing protein [Heyndrickxia oleronia]MCM3240738.1 GAF domain-containing protein [Heyndrickxia oleronia]
MNQNRLNIDEQGASDTYEESYNQPQYPFWKKATCYLLAGLLVIAIIYGFSGIIADILSNSLQKSINRLQIISVVSISYFLYRLTINLGNHWRSSEKNEIGTAVTNFPNPFYDPGFKQGPLYLQKQYQKLASQFHIKNILLKKSNNYSTQLENSITRFEAKLRVLLRHNENVNRLIKSLNFLYLKNDKDFSKQMLKHILSECITILEKDQSDKSISLFSVINEELKIVESVRINAESISKRSFKKGEGFAGYIWDKGEAIIVNQIEEEDERFKSKLPTSPIGSIMGIPLIVDELILGVLCLQSETQDGFNNADLRTVEYYSRMCTLILLYDKMKNNKNGEGDQ